MLILLIIHLYLKIIDISHVILNSISLGDIASVSATIILGVLGYRYTKIQDRRTNEKNKVERLTNYQSLITVDNKLNSDITLDIKTHHNYEVIGIYKNVLITNSNDVVNGLAYAFNLKIMFKCLSDTLPSKIRIKKLLMYDTSADEKGEGKEQLDLEFTNNKYEFKSLAFNGEKILPMECLCCITNEKYKRLGEYDYANRIMNFQIFFEVENQFNVITEINLRAKFEIGDLLNVGTGNLGGQKAQFVLKLKEVYSNIINTYEENDFN